VLALDVPVMSYERTPSRCRVLQGGDRARSRELPGVERVAVGTRAVARRRHVRSRLPVHGEGYVEGERRRGSARAVPHRVAGFFAALGVPIIAGATSRRRPPRREKVVIVSQSLAQRLFPNQDAVNRH
jgi:hypothetical protein